jgi:DNA-binding XRE family transcriptional regulator
MIDYTRILGDVVKRARGKLDRTQNEIASTIEVDVRTVLNIENYKGNPKFEVLFPLIRTLQIDANEIFYPEQQRQSPDLLKLRAVISECSDEEAAFLTPVLESILVVLRKKNAMTIE